MIELQNKHKTFNVDYKPTENSAIKLLKSFHFR